MAIKLVYTGRDDVSPSLQHFKYIKRVRQGNKWKYFYDDDSKGGKSNKTSVKDKIKDKLGYDERDRVKEAKRNKMFTDSAPSIHREWRDKNIKEGHYDTARYFNEMAKDADVKYNKAKSEYEQAKREYRKTPLGKIDAVNEKVDEVKTKVKNKVNEVKNDVKDKLGYDEAERYKSAVKEKRSSKNLLEDYTEVAENTKQEIERRKDWQKSEYWKDLTSDEDIEKWGKFYQYDLSQVSERREEYYQATKEFEKRQQEFYETPLGKIEQAKEKIESGKDYIEDLLDAAKKKRRDKKYERKKKKH
jgi:hypothetical protein